MRKIRLYSVLSSVVLAAAVDAGPLPPRTPANVTVALTGLSTFSGTLKGHCELDQENHRLTVDAGGADGLFVRVNVANPSKAAFKVLLDGLGGKGQIVGHVDSLVINRANYVASAGSGALDDAAGRSGHMRAEGFILAGGTMQTQNLTANVTWTCQ